MIARGVRMVHGLETMKRLNDQAVRRQKPEKFQQEVKVPENIASNPCAARRWVNRPWTKAELAEGQTDVHESYAKDVKTPFKGKEVQSEQMQP